MSSTKTTNMTMNTWVAADDVLMNEFNENFNKIDAKFHPTTGHKHTGALGDAPKVDALNVKISSNRFTSTNLKAALEELFTDANSSLNSIATAVGHTLVTGDTMSDLNELLVSGKQNLLEAINERGADIPANSTLAQMATKIGSANWPEQSYGTAYPIQVAGGKTFKNNDSPSTILTGIETNKGIVTYVGGTNDFVIPKGYYRVGSKVLQDSDLWAENIITGKSIYGYSGGYSPALGYRAGNTVRNDNLIPNRKYSTTEAWSNTISTMDVFSMDPYFYWLAGYLVVAYQKADTKWAIRKYHKDGTILWDYDLAENTSKRWTQGNRDIFFITSSKRLIGFNMANNSVIIDIQFNISSPANIAVTNTNIVTGQDGTMSYYDLTGAYISQTFNSSASINGFLYHRASDTLYAKIIRFTSVQTLVKVYPQFSYYAEVDRQPFLDTTYAINNDGYVYACEVNAYTTKKLDPSNLFNAVITSERLSIYGLTSQEEALYSRNSLSNPSRVSVIKYDFNLKPLWITEPMSINDTRYSTSAFMCDDDGSFYVYGGAGVIKKFTTSSDGYQVIGGSRDGYSVLQ